MSSYIIGLTTYENFGPFEKVAFDFSLPGLTVIEGEINKVGCDSNGAGKSQIFDGLSWCLTGTCMRADMGAGDVVRNGSEGGCCVQTTLHGTHEVVVTRTRGHAVHGHKVMLSVDGRDVTAGTNPQTDVMIADLLGLDFNAFCNSVAFGARMDVASFFSVPDADRKKLLEGMLGLSRFSDAEKIAKARYREVGDALNVLESRCETLTALRDERVRVLAELQQGADDDDDDVSELRDLEARAMARRYAQLQVKQRAYIGEVEDRQQMVIGAVSKQVEAHQAAAAVWAVEHQDAEEDYHTSMRAKAVAESCYSASQQEVTQLAELSGKTCPSCRQPVKGKPAADAKRAAAKRAKEAGFKADAATVDLQAAKVRLDAVMEQRPQRPRDVHGRMAGVVVDAARQTLERYESQQRSWEAQRPEMGRDAARRSQIDRMEGDVGEANEQLHALTGEIEVQQATAARVEFWVQGFGKQGLVSYLMEAAMPEVNASATSYAVRLLGEGAMVKLSATTTLKSRAAQREKISITGYIPGCCTSYAQASKGQKRRMNLALILAFRDLVARRVAAPFGQMLIDEIFDGMDRTGAEQVAELAQELSQAYPVCLIAHDPTLKGVADRVVKVVHDGQAATLEGPGTKWPDATKSAKPQRRTPTKKKTAAAR